MTQNYCKICGHLDKILLFKAESKRYAPGEFFHLYQCQRCGGAYLNPQLDFRSLQRYYPKDYKPHDTKRPGPVRIRELIMKSIRQYVYGCKPNQTLKKNILKESLGYIFDRLTYRSLPWPGKQGRLLDIGCGNGEYLAVARELGWNGYGIESNLNAARHAVEILGLDVQTGDFATVDYPEKHFDVITMWHSLEHFSEPKVIIRKVRALLKDNGVFMIGIPNFSSLDRILFKESWNGLEIPLHAFHFTPFAIKSLLEESGFKVRRILHTMRPIDMMKSGINILEDKYRFKASKKVAVILLMLSIPLSISFSVVKRASIIKIYAI